MPIPAGGGGVIQEKPDDKGGFGFKEAMGLAGQFLPGPYGLAAGLLSGQDPGQAIAGFMQGGNKNPFAPGGEGAPPGGAPPMPGAGMPPVMPGGQGEPPPMVVPGGVAGMVGGGAPPPMPGGPGAPPPSAMGGGMTNPFS